MKKLITLLLVLTGLVTSAMAGTVKVYFKPNTSTWASDNCNAFKIHSWGGPSGDYDVDFTYQANGVYMAEFDTSKGSTNFQFVRKWGVWNYSTERTDVPSSTVYYDASSNSNWDLAGLSGTAPAVYSSKTFYISNTIGDADILPNFMDKNSAAGNNLSSNSDFTYSRTVTGNVIRKGTYGIKIYDELNNWYSDTGYNAWPVSGISTTDDGIYDIVYTFNYVTCQASAVATWQESATITDKYVIAGDAAILDNHGWDTTGSYNVLDVEETTGTLTFNNVSLDAGNKEFKAVKLLCNNGTKYKTIWYDGENSSKNFVRKSIYNLTFTCNTSDLSSSLDASEVAGYFIFGGTTGEVWTLGQRLTESAGVYSAEIADKNYRFCIVANTSLNVYNQVKDDAEWSNVVRPTGESDTEISWANSSDNNTTATNNNQGWKIPASGDNFPADVTVAISYTPGTGKWAVSPYIMRTLPAAAEGYATFSTTVDVQADSRLTPKYASAVSAGAITWAAFTDRKIAKNEGALLTGGNAGWGYQFFPATSVTAPATNLMKPIATKTQLARVTETGYTNFILSKVDDNLGFYKVNENKSWCNAGTAYLQVADGISARDFFLFDDDSNTTAIEAVKKEQKMNGEYYNLAGQRVAQPTKGLYIVNGKKVIVK